MRDNNTIIMKRILFGLLFLAGLSQWAVSGQTRRIGDIYVFGDGSKGVVFYVDPNDPNHGWVAALDDLPDTYPLWTGQQPQTLVRKNNREPNSLNASTPWVYSGMENTQRLLESGRSPAAMAVGYQQGWYIPDIVQLRKFYSVLPLVSGAVEIAGGDVMTMTQYAHWSSTKSLTDNEKMYYLQYDGGVSQASGTVAFAIRPVREYWDTAFAYWLDNPYFDTMTVSPEEDTFFEAAVVYHSDTLFTGSLVVVHENYGVDTLYDTTYVSEMPYSFNVDPSFVNIDVSFPHDTIIRRELLSEFGCDSAVVLMLTVLEDDIPVSSDTVVFSCGPFEWYGETFTHSGEYAHTLASVSGHDSVVTLHLNVGQTVYDTLYYAVMPSEIVDNQVTVAFSHFQNVESPGIYFQNDTLVSEEGCDSIVTIYLIVEEIVRDTVCEYVYLDDGTWLDNTEFYIWNGNVVDLSTVDDLGYYELPGTMEVNGRELNVITYFDLTWKPVHESEDAMDLCLSGESYETTYNGLVTVSVGADGSVSLSALDDDRVEVLLGESPGTYILKTHTVDGCDSIVTLTVRVGDVHRETVVSEVLHIPGEDYDWELAGHVFRIEGAGVLTNADTLPGAGGCDSITERILIVEEPHYDTICDREHLTDIQEWRDNVSTYCWEWNGASNCIAGMTPDAQGYYEFPGTRTIHGRTVDTVSYLMLTVKPTYESEDAMDLCLSGESYETTYNGQATVSVSADGSVSVSALDDDRVEVFSDESPGTYILKTHTVDGCDSVVTLTVRVGDVRRETVVSEVLHIPGEDYDWELAGHVFRIEGAGVLTYADTLPGAGGCDSITERILIVEEPHYDTICDREYLTDIQEWRDNVSTYCWEWNGASNCIADLTLDAQGYYEFPGTRTIHGRTVDTVSYLMLTVNHSAMGDTTAVKCGRFTWHGIEYTETPSVAPIFTYQTDSGCDSIVTLYLTIRQLHSMTVSKTICASELPYAWNGVTFTEAGTKSAILQAVDGCDSVVEMTLHVDTLSLHEISHANETCGDDGSIVVAAIDGPDPIRYSIDGVDYQPSYEFGNLSDGHYKVYAKDDNGCVATVEVEIAPAVVPELYLTCPPTYYDTLAYGDCVMTIYPDEIGTPTAFITPVGREYDVFVDLPEGNIYHENVNMVTWTMIDKMCDYRVSCNQEVIVVFPQCPDAVDCEGNVYAGVRIGCDCWTQTNLLSNCYGEPNECEESGECEDPIPCVYEYENGFFPDVVQNVERYGRLYCAEAALHDSVVNENGHIQGICPVGWYLPTSDKYEELYAIGGGTSIMDANGLRSPLYWIDGGGDNATGFSALPAGLYNGERNRFEGMTALTYFWSVEVVNSHVVTHSYVINYYCSEVRREDLSSGNAISVRCIKEKE